MDQSPKRSNCALMTFFRHLHHIALNQFIVYFIQINAIYMQLGREPAINRMSLWPKSHLIESILLPNMLRYLLHSIN